MNIKVIGKNIDITDAIRDYVETKADRLEKFENENTELTVVCRVEREEQIVELQLSHNGDFIKIEEKNDDLYASIDLALDRLERQMRKDKEKRADKNRDASIRDTYTSAHTNDAQEEGEITKTKCYEAKPLSLEDAKLKLASSDDMFLVFINADNKEEVNVLYKRNDNSFGLVIPE